MGIKKTTALTAERSPVTLLWTSDDLLMADYQNQRGDGRHREGKINYNVMRLMLEY